MKERENWEDLLQKFDQKNKTSKLWLVAAIAIPLVLIGLFLYKNHAEKAKIQEQAVAVSQLREALVDSINTQDILSEQLKQRSLRYLDLLNKKALDSLQTYYADTLEWYYVNLQNASREQVKAAEKSWFRKKPHAYARLDSLDIFFSEDEEANAHIDIHYSVDSITFKPMLLMLKFNEKGQITFVKSYDSDRKTQ